MRKPKKDTVIIATLAIILAALIGGTVWGFQQRQEAVDARSVRNTELLHERIAIGSVRNQITEAALHELCVRMNNKFGKLIPLEKQARKNIKISPLYKGHEKQRHQSLKLVNDALVALQPDSCNIKIVVPKTKAKQSSVQK